MSEERANDELAPNTLSYQTPSRGVEWIGLGQKRTNPTLLQMRE